MPDIAVQPLQQAPQAPQAAPSPDVQAAPPAAPQAAQQPAAPPALPPDLLKIHAIQGLISGAPAAVSMDISQFAKTEDGKLIAENAQALQSAGLGFYKSMSGDTGAIYNQLYLHPAELQAADRAGKLTQLAPSWQKVDHALSKAGAAHPAFNHRGAPAGTPIAPSPAVPQAASGAIPSPGKPLPAKAQNQLLQARVAATQPAAPTAGAVPGGSQLLNKVLKPVV